MIRIGEQEYQVRTLSAGDLPALANLVAKAGPLLADLKPGSSPDMTKLLPLASELIATVSRLLDCPVADLERMPLHEFIGLVEQVAGEWMALNAEYLDQHVTPALNRLAAAVNGATAGQTTDTAPAPPPQS